MLIHADEGAEGGMKRVESFVVGKDVTKGEKAVWIVEGGKYKASLLLPVGEEKGEGDRLLISEVSCAGEVCGGRRERLLTIVRRLFRALSIRIMIS